MLALALRLAFGVPRAPVNARARVANVRACALTHFPRAMLIALICAVRALVILLVFLQNHHLRRLK